MEAIQEFIKEVIGDDELYNKIKIRTSSEGFYSRWIKPNGDFQYEIFIPEDKMKLKFATRLTILHEIGHILFNQMFYNNHTKLLKIMTNMHRRRMFHFFQGIWYWNPIIRFVKKKFGFSTTLHYTKSDLYDEVVSTYFTRGDNEFFCDYFALFIKKNYNFFLDI